MKEEVVIRVLAHLCGMSSRRDVRCGGPDGQGGEDVGKGDEDRR